MIARAAPKKSVVMNSKRSTEPGSALRLRSGETPLPHSCASPQWRSGVLTASEGRSCVGRRVEKPRITQITRIEGSRVVIREIREIRGYEFHSGRPSHHLRAARLRSGKDSAPLIATPSGQPSAGGYSPLAGQRVEKPRITQITRIEGLRVVIREIRGYELQAVDRAGFCASERKSCVGR